MTRLEALIADVEADKPVNLPKVAVLMALDAAASDAKFVNDMAEARSNADEQLLRR